ncbi:helix-turn-helix transcriptional regulator [Oceanobacillus caeni]|uniref:Cro/Cl family transcriptional regulator n=1 Tax=Oceanobacillus caeni TaxID=405946 RepID=A0ABR5MHS5_9BACI|nr:MULTISPECIES: helix-turn-helix transcriptional regulator [Bacillaceae]KKE79433.1 Cro/Cl family transcriptional regulator [Bacilli bacterium VT-13-104]PZD88270.1 transcriptional regulator [Bacilli bacterium]KPH73232.1 Cro/Cl family transcriptional regulator [Oceanobacillus caeni]MBU8791179.1 helix-turn-helix transcriptional regulator [Oceanobacillus caeni]MCR1834043.1 helix-turn-helix transcriptional regulator [Oceanobacillus caeni]
MKNKILELRKGKGFTQDVLAKKCNVSRQTINAIENDRYDPTLQLAFKIARVLNTTVDNVFKP